MCVLGGGGGGGGTIVFVVNKVQRQASNPVAFLIGIKFRLFQPGPWGKFVRVEDREVARRHVNTSACLNGFLLSRTLQQAL